MVSPFTTSTDRSKDFLAMQEQIKKEQDARFRMGNLPVIPGVNTSHLDQRMSVRNTYLSNVQRYGSSVGLSWSSPRQHLNVDNIKFNSKSEFGKLVKDENLDLYLKLTKWSYLVSWYVMCSLSTTTPYSGGVAIHKKSDASDIFYNFVRVQYNPWTPIIVSYYVDIGESDWIVILGRNIDGLTSEIFHQYINVTKLS